MALGFPRVRGGIGQCHGADTSAAWHMWGTVAATLQHADLGMKYTVGLLSLTCINDKTSHSGMAHNHQCSASSAIHVLLALHSFYGVLSVEPRLHTTGLWLYSALHSFACLNARCAHCAHQLIARHQACKQGCDSLERSLHRMQCILVKQQVRTHAEEHTEAEQVIIQTGQRTKTCITVGSDAPHQEATFRLLCHFVNERLPLPIMLMPATDWC